MATEDEVLHVDSDTAGLPPPAHTIRLHFNHTPEDQALYAALMASSEREDQTPVWRQIKHQLLMAMGIRPPDGFLLQRLGYLPVDPYEFATNAAAAYDPPPTKPPVTLRLIPGGADALTSAQETPDVSA